MNDKDSESQINSFKEFQEKLENDGYATPKGIILPKGLDLQENIWSNFDKPISARTTYYYGVYDERGDETGNEDNQHISVYAQRLGNVVDEILDATGKNKVILISHSMGGLVSRSYIKDYNGKDKVDRLITIGTPNHGTYGYSSLGCESLFGRTELSPECENMQANSSFIINLNLGKVSVKILTIRGITSSPKNGALFCPNSGSGDEVVCLSSVPLDGAINRLIYSEGLEWESSTFHSALIHPSEVEEVYNYVIDYVF